MSIEEYEKELENLKKEKENYDVADSYYISRLNKQINGLSTLIGELKKLKEKEKSIKEHGYIKRNEKKKLKELAKEVKAAENKYNIVVRNNSTSPRDFFSSIIGQVDKKIHNFRYRIGKDDIQEEKMKQKWENKKSKIGSRYVKGGLLSYFLPRAGIVLVGAILMPTFSFAFGSAAATVASIGLAVGGAVTLGKTISTVYNKIRYGGPRLERQYNIQKGSFIENIKSSWNSLTKSNNKTKSDSRTDTADVNKENTDHISSTHESDKVSEELKTSLFGSSSLDDKKTVTHSDDVTDGKVSDELRSSLFEDVVDESRTSSPISADAPIVRNRRLGRFNDTESTDTYVNDLNSSLEGNKINMNLDDKYTNSSNTYKNNMVQTKESNLKFSDAVHILRDKQNNYTEKEKDEALSVVARSFGNKKVSTEDIRKKLTDYNKLEQLLGYYGNKVKTNTATLEDMSFYSKLLEQFGRYNGNDYTLTDLMADEAYYSTHPDEKGKGR